MGEYQNLRNAHLMKHGMNDDGSDPNQMTEEDLNKVMAFKPRE